MFRKKVIMLSMVFILVATSLAGCRPASKTDANKDGETVKVVWYRPGNKPADHDMVQDAFNKKIKEKLNVEVDFQVIPYGDYNQRMNVMTAAREGFDIAFTSNWSNNIYNNISKGAFMPLDDLIKNHAPGLKEALPEVLFAAATINNKTYAVPNYQIMYWQWAVMMPKDLVEKYNFDVDAVPQKQGFKTIRAIEPYLKSIKDNEPNLYPISTGYSFDLLDVETIGNNPIVIRKDSTDDQLFIRHETDEWKKNNELFADWFKKGFIRSDILSVIDDRADKDNQKYAAFFEVTKPGGLGELAARYGGREYIEILLEEPYLAFDAGMGTANAISQTSKNPEHAIKLLEIMNTDVELYNLMCFGIEDVHYTKVSDTQIKPVENSKYQPNSSWMFGNQFNAYLLPGQEPGVWEETHKINMSAKKSPIHGFVFNADPIKEKLSQVNSLIKEYSHLYVDNGARVPELMTKLKQAGIEDVKAEIQSQIKKWRENN